MLPIGSIEQHGDHLPVATDTLLADAVTELGARRVDDDVPIAVAPPLWAGYSPHHLPFGGTLTLSFGTMLDVVEELADAALSNGFDTLVLLKGHGGDKPLIDAATSTVGADHPEAEVVGLTYFEWPTRSSTSGTANRAAWPTAASSKRRRSERCT